MTRAGGDPIEFIPITIPNIGPGGPDSTQYDYYVIITNNTSTTDGPSSLKYIVYKNDIQFRQSFPGQYASTISGQGNAEGAITIGAARYYHVPGHPLLEDQYKNITKPKIENGTSFGSSVGGTIVNDESTPRLQPSLTGPDGVTTTVRLGPDYPVVDNYSNFYGTSAAAPHVAAGVALILQGLNKFKGQNIENMEPAEMKKLIQKTAVNMRPDDYSYNFEDPPDPSHYDFISGAGLINVDAAMRTFAAPQPFQIRLIRETGKIPCQESFVLTIVGENFSTNTEIYITNEGGTRQKIDPSDVTFVSPEKILVTINSCIGNPLIEAFTPATDPPLLVVDGGWSNGIRLFDKEIIVQTNVFNRKYGQDNPPQTALAGLITVTLIDNGDSTEIVPDDFDLYGLDNDNLKVNTTATRYSEVNNLDYTIYRDFSYPADAALIDNYRYTFKEGDLVIEKMPLKVIPLVNNSTNATVVEGGYIGPVTFDYQFWQEQPADPVVLKDVAKKFHEAFLPGNALAVVKDFKKIQGDGTTLSDADLEDMSMMTTFKALKNSRKFTVDPNNKLIPETNPNSLVSQYLVDLASESIFDYTNNPKEASFYEGYPGITKKALLSKTALENYEGQVHPIINGTSSPTLVSLLNGSASATLAPLFNGTSTLAPLINGNQLSVIDGKLATLNSAGELVAVPNSPSILYLNGTGGVGSLVYIINGATSPTLAPLFNGAKIEMLNNSTLTLNSTNSYIKFENNDSAGLYVGGLQSINNAISGTLMFILNGVQAPLPNYKELENADGTLMNAAGNTLAPLFNGSFIALNATSGVGGLATLLNGGGVGGLATLLNGTRSATLAPLFNSKSTLASLLNGAGFNTLASIINNVDLQFTNGAPTSPTLASIVNNSGGGGVTISDNHAVIVDETDVDEQNANYLGALFGINMITGLELGTQTVVPGILVNPNFAITYVNSHVEIVVDPSCLHTHSTAKNFSSTPTPQTATTLWINVTTKVSGQLDAPGKYILFKNGTFELKNIDYTPVDGGNLTVPDGIIIAKDSSVSQFTPFTDWDGSKWITWVPVNFASSSDLFITGKILNSSNGFAKVNNNATTAIKGYFYTNASFSDQWTYAMAAYRPYFNYSDIDEPGDVVAINLTGNGKAAGTPMPIITNNYWSLVPGGSGGGGNNYTGSTLSWAKLNPCPTVNSIIPSSANSNSMIITMMESESSPDRLPSFNMYPNPASNRINISFVPDVTGQSRTILYTMDGKKAIEINNGMAEAGKSYLRTIDVGRLSRGVYLVQVWTGNKVSVGKVVINR
ncbi:MAG TPA: S8 family serine peptidase [Chitinophagaceae bacterium]|nr:S8 family serine peptidase [Chitinophagaceae bacterium]